MVGIAFSGGAARAHDIAFRAPVYASGAGVQLHRYADPDFVEQFLSDLTGGRLEDSAWMASDRFGDFDDHVALRLPVHRMFYQVSVELCCDRIGHPALNPRRLADAGFVIRRVGGGREDAWMIDRGAATGWTPVVGEERDPDLSRRICRNGCLRTEPQPAYSGEEIHPLKAMVDRSTGRARTILHGYLPLGGHHYFRDELPEADSDEQSTALAFKTLSWPFGQRHAPADKTTPPRQVHRGSATPAFAELLRRLVYEEHLHERDDDALVDLTRRTWFYDLDDAFDFADRTRQRYEGERRFSLYDYVTEWAASDDDHLLRWIMDFDRNGSLDRLPGRRGRSGTLDLSLLVSAADTQEYRLLLEQSVLKRFDAARREIPVPKFQQRELDVYQIVPFVRYHDDGGCLRLYWGREADRSVRFRVAAPFDPQASRPSVVQMPAMKDLRRGLANGLGLMTPSDTMDMLNRLRTDEGLVPDLLPEDESPGLGLQWICSFSIPIVTIAAMILLMIIVSVLDFFLRWMPFVRICFPLPGAEDDAS